jgi:hypothetical protein
MEDAKNAILELELAPDADYDARLNQGIILLS